MLPNNYIIKHLFNKLHENKNQLEKTAEDQRRNRFFLLGRKAEGTLV